MANHRDTASRIWRTIVCSGAMLGVPLGAAADTPKPAPAKQAPAKPAPPPAKPALPPAAALAAELETEGKALDPKIAELQKERAALTEAAKLAKSTTDVQALIAKATAQVQNAKNDAQRAGAALVLQRIAPSVAMSEQDLITRINEAIEEVQNAQNDADRKKASAKLAALQKEMADRQAAARPRNPPNERPTGRGFILA